MLDPLATPSRHDSRSAYGWPKVNLQERRLKGVGSGRQYHGCGAVLRT